MAIIYLEKVEEKKMELSRRMHGIKSWAMADQRNGAEDIGDTSRLVTVNTPDCKLTGWMFGNDEDFPGDDFVQYMICTDESLYVLRFAVPDGTDLGDLDYSNAIGVDKMADQYDGSHEFDPMFDR